MDDSGAHTTKIAQASMTMPIAESAHDAIRSGWGAAPVSSSAVSRLVFLNWLIRAITSDASCLAGAGGIETPMRETSSNVPVSKRKGMSHLVPHSHDEASHFLVFAITCVYCSSFLTAIIHALEDIRGV